MNTQTNYNCLHLVSGIQFNQRNSPVLVIGVEVKGCKSFHAYIQQSTFQKGIRKDRKGCLSIVLMHRLWNVGYKPPGCVWVIIRRNKRKALHLFGGGVRSAVSPKKMPKFCLLEWKVKAYSWHQSELMSSSSFVSLDDNGTDPCTEFSQVSHSL